MTMTSTPEDIFVGNSTLPVKPAMRQIRCLGTRRNGQQCDQLMLIVDASLVYDEYAERIEGKCPRCGQPYALADYRVKRV